MTTHKHYNKGISKRCLADIIRKVKGVYPSAEFCSVDWKFFLYETPWGSREFLSIPMRKYGNAYLELKEGGNWASPVPASCIATSQKMHRLVAMLQLNFPKWVFHWEG